MSNKVKGFFYDGDEPSMRRIALVWSLSLLTVSLYAQYFTAVVVSVQVITALIGLVIVALGSTAVKKKQLENKENGQHG